MQSSYLNSAIKQFEYYKNLGDNTFTQLSEQEMFISHNDSNSIAILVKHIVGNMLSRWTNFLSEDGEKKWRNRDDEFINTFKSKADIINSWKRGWECLFDAILPLQETDLEKIIYIRNQGHTVD